VLWEFHNIRKGWVTRDIYIPVMREYNIGSYYKLPPLHITRHTTVIDGEGNCVWEYLTAEQNRGIALLHEDTLRK
jgi:hypothetical protein